MAIRKAIKQGWRAIWIPFMCGLAALVVLLAIGFIGIGFSPGFLEKYNQYFGGIAAGVSAVVVAVLVGVTIMYARAAKQQADASVKMAEEMREQRYTDSLPLLVPKIIPRLPARSYNLAHNEIDYLELTTGLKVSWRNLGKGVAVNSRFSLWSVPQETAADRVVYFPQYKSIAIGVSEEQEIDFYELRETLEVMDVDESYQPRLEAEYHDIHERKITTVQKFSVEEQNGNKRAFLGELYFEVNGRRLGQEAVQDD